MRRFTGTEKRRRGTAALAVAALLSLGASMTSFAAQGWHEEGGTWVFYNEDGTRVTDEWYKSGNSWYYLDSYGAMATDTLIEYDGNYYYVDANGSMVTSQWVQTNNTNAENLHPSEDLPGDWWYYLGSNGQAYTAPDSGKTRFQTIAGKKYAFDANARMMTGWVDEHSNRVSEEEALTDGVYYLGGENDGARTFGWSQVEVVDDTDDESTGTTNWFYFDRSGKKLTAPEGQVKAKTINGQKYGFDDNGRMIFGWGQTAPKATASEATGSEIAVINPAPLSITNYRYFGDDGNSVQVHDGWFEAVPNKAINQIDYNDGAERWYYASNSGEPCRNEFKTIDGKRYCFDGNGQMLTGLQAVYYDDRTIWNRELDSETLLKDATTFESLGETKLMQNGKETNINIRTAIQLASQGRGTYSVYYFGDEDNGAAKEGIIDIKMDDTEYRFRFKNKSAKGEGLTGENKSDRKLYQYGRRLVADKDDKYTAYFTAAPKSDDEQEASYQGKYAKYCGYSTYFFPGHAYPVDPEMVNQMVYDINNGIVKVENDKIYLVQKNGVVRKDSNTYEDGNDCHYSLRNGSITGYYDMEDGQKQYIGVDPDTGI